MGNKKYKPTNKYKFEKYLEIGSPDAETDSLLEKTFIEKDALGALIDTTNQRSILIGRTGSGKSAILRHIESIEQKVIRIEPEAMSLRFLSNSSMLQYFQENDVNLNFFYKILWKHVLVIELLRLYFLNDKFKQRNWIQELKTKLMSKRNGGKEKALKYLDKWSNEFWLDAEIRIKEIEETVLKKFEKELGIDIKTLKAKSNISGENQILTKFEIKTKAEHVISETLAQDIHEIINILKDEIFISDQKKYFIIIDDLDKEWISTPIRYDLIGAMIEVIKEFQVFKGVKIIIALRDNLYQLLFTGANHKGGQREKFKPLYVELTWSALELKEFLNKRLALVTENNVDIRSAFEKQHKDGSDGFMYMLDRTFYRPRDVISFINHAIENSGNNAHFTLDVLKKAEIDYSNDRLQAVEDEWGENYGEIIRILSFLHGKQNGFIVTSITENDFTNIFFDESVSTTFKGELLSWILKWKDGDLTFFEFIRYLFFLLYQLGIVGIKKNATHSLQFFYEKNVYLTQSDISEESKIYIHKAFYASLKINTRSLEPNTFN